MENQKSLILVLKSIKRIFLNEKSYFKLCEPLCFCALVAKLPPRRLQATKCSTKKPLPERWNKDQQIMIFEASTLLKSKIGIPCS